MNDYRQFYNGPKGENYIISEIFSNSQELLNDLALEDNSPNPIGSLVMISYGDVPGTNTYNDNKNNDKNYGYLNLNNSIWEKRILTKDKILENNLNTIPKSEKLRSGQNWVYVFQTSVQGEVGTSLNIVDSFNIDIETNVENYNQNDKDWWKNKGLEDIAVTDLDNHLFNMLSHKYTIENFKNYISNDTIIGNYYLYKKNQPNDNIDKIYLSVYYIRNGIAFSEDNSDNYLNTDLSKYFYLSKISGIYIPPKELTQLQGFYYDPQKERIKIGQMERDNSINVKNNQIIIGNHLDLSAAPEGAIAIGQYNKPATPETLFVIANGTDALNQNNLFEIIQPQSNVLSYDIKLGDAVIHNQLINLNDMINLVNKIAKVPSVKHFLEDNYTNSERNNWILNYNGVWKPSNIQFNINTITTLKIYCAFGNGYTKIINNSQESLIKIQPQEIILTDLSTNTPYSSDRIISFPTEVNPYYSFSSMPAGTRYKLHLTYSNNIVIDKEFEVPAENYNEYEEVGVMDEFYLQTEKQTDGSEIKRNDWDFIIAIMNSNFPKTHSDDIPGRRLTDLWRIGDYTKFLDNNYAVIIDTNHDIIYEDSNSEDFNSEEIDLQDISTPNPIVQENDIPQTIEKATYTFMVISPVFENDKITIKYAKAPYRSGSRDFSLPRYKTAGYYNVQSAGLRTKTCFTARINQTIPTIDDTIITNFIKALKPVYKRTYGDREEENYNINKVNSIHKVFLLSPIEIFGNNSNITENTKIPETQYKIFENNNFNLLFGEQKFDNCDVLRSPAPTPGLWYCLNYDRNDNLTAIAREEISTSYGSAYSHRRPVFCL